MPRSNQRGLRLPIISMGPFECREGNSKILENGTDEDFVTSIWLMLPLEEKEFVQGNFQITQNGWNSPAQIRLFRIKDESEDPIFQLANRFRFGANMELQNLPFSIFSDNRGKYPCFYAHLNFPFRLNDWKSTGKDKMERKNSTGIFSTDKALALKLLNAIFSNDHYLAKVSPLHYDDVTNFVEQYFSKSQPQTLLYQHLTLLDAKDAFEDAIIEFLGEGLWEQVSGFVRKKEERIISTEADLHNLVLEAVTDVIKHHVENRYWIQPFWNEPHKTTINGKRVNIPKQPKRERSIQPTLALLLSMTLQHFGIHVERETDEGVGLLDFKCLYTTKKGKPLCVLVEFKLAHNMDIEESLRTQLPAYLTANRTKYGLYLVMWFKDDEGKIFKKPLKCNKQEMVVKLKRIAEAIQQEKEFNITTEVIDASVKRSASKL